MVSINIHDGLAFVSDNHLNSWMIGEKINHKLEIYLEYLGSKDKYLSDALDISKRNA